MDKRKRRKPSKNPKHRDFPRCVVPAGTSEKGRTKRSKLQEGHVFLKRLFFAVSLLLIGYFLLFFSFFLTLRRMNVYLLARVLTYLQNVRYKLHQPCSGLEASTSVSSVLSNSLFHLFAFLFPSVSLLLLLSLSLSSHALIPLAFPLAFYQIPRLQSLATIGWFTMLLRFSRCTYISDSVIKQLQKCSSLSSLQSILEFSGFY